jgi:hypothetical protein
MEQIIVLSFFIVLVCYFSVGLPQFAAEYLEFYVRQKFKPPLSKGMKNVFFIRKMEKHNF